jgi:hypothetical protein
VDDGDGGEEEEEEEEEEMRVNGLRLRPGAACQEEKQRHAAEKRLLLGRLAGSTTGLPGLRGGPGRLCQP